MYVSSNSPARQLLRLVLRRQRRQRVYLLWTINGWIIL